MTEFVKGYQTLAAEWRWLAKRAHRMTGLDGMATEAGDGRLIGLNMSGHPGSDRDRKTLTQTGP